LKYARTRWSRLASVAARAHEPAATEANLLQRVRAYFNLA
jgi:hypothetical protein